MTFTSPTSSLTPSQVVNAFIENDTKIESIEVVKNYVEQFDSTKTQLLEEINLLLKEMKTAQSQLSSAKPQEYKDFLVLQGIKEYHGTDNDTAQQMLDWCSRRRESLGDALKELFKVMMNADEKQTQIAIEQFKNYFCSLPFSKC